MNRGNGLSKLGLAALALGIALATCGTMARAGEICDLIALRYSGLESQLDPQAQQRLEAAIADCGGVEELFVLARATDYTHVEPGDSSARQLASSRLFQLARLLRRLGFDRHQMDLNIEGAIEPLANAVVVEIQRK